MRRVFGVSMALAVAFSIGLPSASKAEVGPWCPAPAPCIISATVNGAPVTPSDPNWDVDLQHFTGAGSNDLRWTVLSKTNPDPFVLGPGALDDVWVIRLDTGGVVPRVAFTHGANVSISRGAGEVTVTATPVIIIGECDQSVWPWTCPGAATKEWVGYLDGTVTDYNAWSDVAQRESMFGMNYSTNIAATSLPPEIENDPATGFERLLIRLANPHFRMDGVTVFKGFAHLRIPNLFLRRVYGIDDPGSLTGAGLSPTVSGPSAGSGSVTVAPESGGGAMLVDIEDLTFSHRLVRVNRGNVKPTKPKKVRAIRVSDERGKLRFAKSKSRGSRIVRYKAKCKSGSGIEKGKRKQSPVVLRSLDAGTRYRCRVRAISKAGPGPWSKRVRMPARP